MDNAYFRSHLFLKCTVDYIHHLIIHDVVYTVRHLMAGWLDGTYKAHLSKKTNIYEGTLHIFLHLVLPHLLFFSPYFYLAPVLWSWWGKRNIHNTTISSCLIFFIIFSIIFFFILPSSDLSDTVASSSASVTGHVRSSVKGRRKCGNKHKYTGGFFLKYRYLNWGVLIFSRIPHIYGISFTILSVLLAEITVAQYLDQKA